MKRKGKKGGPVAGTIDGDALLAAGRLQLPPELEGERAALAKALDEPIPLTWPEDEGYLNAQQAHRIAHVLIGVYHQRLANARISYLFRKEIKKGTKALGGKAAKAGGKLEFLASVDFVIEFNWQAWKLLRPAQRLALVDHELLHCDVDLETGRWLLVEHDVEEFGAIVRRWGLWQRGIEAFARVVVQGDYFKADPVPPAAAE